MDKNDILRLAADAELSPTTLTRRGVVEGADVEDVVSALEKAVDDFSASAKKFRKAAMILGDKLAELKMESE